MTKGTRALGTAGLAERRCRYALAMAWLLAATCLPSASAPAQTGQAAGAVQAPVQSAHPPANAAASATPRGLFPTQPPPARASGGFIYAFGRWWDSTRGRFEDLTKQANAPAHAAAEAGHDAMQGVVSATTGAAAASQQALKGAAEATKDAATALFRLPGVRFVEVHQACATAANGAPDCRTAATNACRAKGFTAGHPVGVQSSENCPPAVWMSGQRPASGECPEQTVVLMVACQ
jgi:hypothetical protein